MARLGGSLGWILATGYPIWLAQMFTHTTALASLVRWLIFLQCISIYRVNSFTEVDQSLNIPGIQMCQTSVPLSPRCVVLGRVMGGS